MPWQLKPLLFLSVAWIAVAQVAPVLRLTGPASVSAGGSARLNISLSGSAGKGVAAIQFSVSLPSGITLGAPSLAPAWIAAGFSIFCGSAICNVVNTTKVNPRVTDGRIATIPVIVSARFAPGTVSVPMTTMAATNLGKHVNMSAGAIYSIKVQRPPPPPRRSR